MSLLKRYPITTFFLIAYVISWTINIVLDITQINFVPLKLVAEFAPTFAALIVTAALYGSGGVRALLARVGKWRVGLRWYALVLIEPVAVQLLGFWGYTLLGGHVQFRSPGLGFLFILFLGLILSVGEEIGWRGFALPHLQSRMSMLGASLIIGILWGLWHTPNGLTSLAVFALPSTYVAMLWFVAFSCVSSFLMSWVYNHTEGSIFLMIIFHLTLTIAGQFFITPSLQPGQIGPTELTTLLQCLIILVAALTTRARKHAQQAVA